jgi:hypothetical protein
MKRSIRLISVVSVILLAEYISAQTGQIRQEAKTIYFLRDDTHSRWCGYANESRYKAQAGPLNAMVVGGADYDDGHIAKVRVTEDDETGDWAVYDEYAVGEGGRIQSLKRTINVIPENNSEEQVFSITDGKAVKQRSTHRELRSGKPTEHTVDWFEAPPIITSLQAFPFWTLLGRSQAIWADGEACVPDAAK